MLYTPDQDCTCLAVVVHKSAAVVQGSRQGSRSEQYSQCEAIVTTVSFNEGVRRSGDLGNNVPLH